MLTLDFPGCRRLVDALDAAVGQREQIAITEALRKSLCNLMRDRTTETPRAGGASEWAILGSNQ